MNKIRIISNPYDKITDFQKYNEQTMDWENITSENYPNSKLVKQELHTQFFPFKIKEIVDAIILEFGEGEDLLVVQFKGTTDHFNELSKVVSSTNSSVNIQLEYDNQYLLNADKVLPEIIDIFNQLKPTVNLCTKNKNQINENLNKFSDSSSDCIPLCVIGSYSSGKSTFINALIGKEILPSGDNPVTAKVFKIHQSDEDCTKIQFDYLGEDIEVMISNNHYLISEQAPNQLKSILEQSISQGKDYCTNQCLVFINELKEDESKPLITITTSFENGTLSDSNSKFVILDTPGSNSQSNISHTEVLDEALHGLTNGLPLFICESNGLDTRDNFELYDKLKNMKEIDSRFTMIIVNKADNSNLPEHGFNEEQKEDLLSNAIPKCMYSIGIYFTSSIMALGAKTNGNLSDNFYRRLYKTNLNNFSNPEEECYTQLYKYNIMPQQIQEESCKKCEANNNLVYSNSGFYAIEDGILNFVNKYSAYNKCRQSLLYLENVVSLVNEELEELTQKTHDEKEQLIQSLKEEQRQLAQRISGIGVERQFQYRNEGHAYLSTVSKDTTPKVTIDELIEFEHEFTNKYRDDLKYDNYKDYYDKSKDQFMDALKDTVSDFDINDFPDKLLNVKNKGGKVFKSLSKLQKNKNEADKLAAKDLLDAVEQKMYEDSKTFFNELNKKSIEYWDDKSERIRLELARIVTESDALTETEKNMIHKTIMDYRSIRYKQTNSFNFRLSDYKMKLFSEKLIKTKLASDANKKLTSKAIASYHQIITSHEKTFERWTYNLIHLIENNIIDLNPTLSKLNDQIKHKEDKINDLVEHRNLVETNMNIIRQKIDWQGE